MRLRRLELFGFKSFADRTALAFESSLTGIVGPNGCGKSNVVDAMRWVLGETRPTSMRGGEMTDVVFKGSVSRAAMSVAEVTMVLDNSASTIPERGAEVSITRRVFRSGEGEYLIDGEKVRLKDLRDMLFDTGLGSRGYSVLEQGRIDAVLSQNPLDRRAIFEEAAGISRYRQRRKEIAARLLRVQTDVEQVELVVKELATRVRSLKIQAGKAERFLAVRDEWRAERARYLAHRLFDQRGALAGVQMSIDELDGRVDGLRRLRSDGESDVAAREREQLTLAAEVDRMASEVARLSGEGRACDERHANLLARAQQLRAQSAEESQRSLSLASELEMREAELDSARTAVGRAEGSLEGAQVVAETHAASLRAARNDYRDVRGRSERQNEAVLGLLHERTEAQNTLRHLEQARPNLLARIERQRARTSEASAACEGARVASESAQRALAEATVVLGELESDLRGVAERAGVLDAEHAGLDKARGEREIERARKQARVDALQDWERERESLEAGARALLEGVKSGAAPCAASELAGVVADHLRTSTELARALDAALGSAALGLVVRERDLAARIVAWLGGTRAGQVGLFLPAALADAPSARKGARIEDCTRLVDLVECSAGFETLARWLVGDVWIAPSLERAFELVREHPEQRFVTAEGDLVTAAGVRGGHREIAHGAVGRRASAAELVREIAALDAQLAEDRERLAVLADERQALQSARAELERKLQSQRALAGELRASERAGTARRAELETALEALQAESAALAAEERRLANDIDHGNDRLAVATSAFERENAALSELERERHGLEQKIEELAAAESRAQVERARVEAELEGWRGRVRDLDRAVNGARTELERARRLTQEHDAGALNAERTAHELRQQGDRLLVERADAEQRQDELRRAEREGREAVSVHRSRVDAVTREIEALSVALSEKRLEAQRIELACNELAVRCQEDLAKSESELLIGFEPSPELALDGALDALEAKVTELKQKLDAIGPVNTEAVAELSEAQTRFDFLTRQHEDLASSKKSLSEALEHLNQESVRLFVETFNEVREHFQQLFRQLFGGGKADLELAMGADPLEAGIEISARPPGREMLPIGLLSGGQRTMTALALLFAVFKARPSPFCVLDEVDAALDDANVGRFLAMLDGFRTDTQFIVVTHNKGTMAACDRLYGITMETKGVSTWVAVDFREVERFVPEATGNAAEASKAREEHAAASAEGREERTVVLTPVGRPQIESDAPATA